MARRSYFPVREPRTRERFPINDRDPDDQYAPLYRPTVVDTINDLYLPRYGLGQLHQPSAWQAANTCRGPAHRRAWGARASG